MYLAPEVLDRIRAAIAERISPMPSCWLCAHHEWQLVDGITVPPVAEHLRGAGGRTRRLVLIAISCGNCGNTLFLNMENLGLDDVLTEMGANMIQDQLDV